MIEKRKENKKMWWKIAVVVVILLLGWFGYKKINANEETDSQYRTATVSRGNLVSTISASGSISSGGNTNIYTSISGQVAAVYVKNGDSVRQGQKIALITLDQDGQRKQSSAWAGYLNAKNSVESAKQNKSSLENQVATAQLAVDTAQDTVNNIENFPKSDIQKETINSNLLTSQKNLEIIKSKLATADTAINAAQSQLSAAWYSYQQASAIIYAPASGIVSNFALVPGLSLANLATDSNTNGSSESTQSVGVIVNPNAQTTATINLSEIDVTQVKTGQKVTMTLSAFADKTFTGKILSINTSGQSNSGVISYPAVIVFDTSLPNIYPNMSVSSNILIDSKDNVLMVPNAAIQKSDGGNSVRVLKDNQVNTVSVEIGISSDSNTEIISELNEGETVIVGSNTTRNTDNSSSATGSVFSSNNRGNMGGFMR